MSQNSLDKSYKLLHSRPEREAELSETFGLSLLAARTIANQGWTDDAEIERFLHPSLKRDWSDPFLLPSMEEGAKALLDAIDKRKRITVYGDFDVDGMTATAVIVLALQGLGIQVDWYIPDRFSEGYGLSKASIEHLLAKHHPELLLTVDNGIAAAEEVNGLLDAGVEVIITDHHVPDELVPQGVPVIDPKLNPSGPGQNLCGAGVALKLLQALQLLSRSDERASRLFAGVRDNYWHCFCDLATLGTVGDVMDLDFENRALVVEGMKRIQNNPRTGLAALLKLLKINPKNLQADELPFSVIPHLNAAGRMGDVETAFKLLLAEDEKEALNLSERIQELNAERKALERDMQEKACSQANKVLKESPNTRVLILTGDDWYEGVKGIVASRLAHQFQRPCILISFAEDVGKGSGRSIGSVDLMQAVAACSDYLVRFGGHKNAVGLTINRSQVSAFQQALNTYLETLPASAFTESIEITGQVTFNELTLSNIEGLAALRPFGKGNPYPLFVTPRIRLSNLKRIGRDGVHMKMRMREISSNDTLEGVYFYPSAHLAEVSSASIFDVVFEPTLNSWRNIVHPQLLIRDLFTPDTTHLTQQLRQAFIGENALLPIQEETLTSLEEGRNTLAIMATGRGKSLIFQIHAARIALAARRASVFVFPLRALVNDQVFHLENALSQFGLNVALLTGETDDAQREITYDGLKTGSVDIVLTTPEYLSLHAKRFAETNRIDFLVIDEAHHAGASKGGNRIAYQDLPRVQNLLGSPTVLCVSATVGKEEAAEISRLFNIERTLSDNTCRENLFLEDYRNIDRADRPLLERIDDESGITPRESFLIDRVQLGTKTVVYVNSRGQAEVLCKLLRQHCPEIAHQIAFYHAGLSRTERIATEKNFRENTLRTIVSTSAFGEGVNISDIRQIVLYHLPFGATEFNQMSGRAGRDGDDAHIYLLFGDDDACINEGILENIAPSKERLGLLFRTIKTMEGKQTQTPPNILHASNSEIGEYASYLAGNELLDATLVDQGLSIFRELELLCIEGRGEQRTLYIADQTQSAQSVSLEDSAFFLEGERLKESFAAFKSWVLSASAEELLARINHPIIP